MVINHAAVRNLVQLIAKKDYERVAIIVRELKRYLKKYPNQVSNLNLDLVALSTRRTRITKITKRGPNKGLEVSIGRRKLAEKEIYDFCEGSVELLVLLAEEKLVRWGPVQH